MEFKIAGIVAKHMANQFKKNYFVIQDDLSERIMVVNSKRLAFYMRQGEIFGKFVSILSFHPPAYFEKR